MTDDVELSVEEVHELLVLLAAHQELLPVQLPVVVDVDLVEDRLRPVLGVVLGPGVDSLQHVVHGLQDTARDDGHTGHSVATHLHDDPHLLLVDHPRVVRVVQLEAPQQLLLNCPVCVQWLLIGCLMLVRISSKAKMIHLAATRSIANKNSLKSRKPLLSASSVLIS